MSTPHWYIVRASKPLEAMKRCQIMLEAYTLATGRTVEPLELRTPNEYVSKEDEPDKMPYSKAREFLFHYIFVYAELNQLDDFLHFRDVREMGFSLVGRRTDGTQVLADMVSPYEIDLFYRACMAYTMHRNNQYVPFYDEEGVGMAEGDEAIVVAGQFEGQTVKIVSPPEGNDKTIRVSLEVFGCVGVPIEMSIDDVEIVKFAASENECNRYSLFDDFFAFYAQDSVLERIVMGQSTSRDMVRALQMKPSLVIHDKGPNHYRDSRRLQFVKQSARVVVNHILGATSEFANSREQWLAMRANYKYRRGDDALLKVLGALVK